MILPRPCDIERGAPCRPDAADVVRVSSDVRATLDKGVLHYEVEEVFVNRGGAVGEADYLFPLPRGAAFRDLKLEINGEMVGGETMGADEARRIYEEIVRSRKDPALVEWMGQGLLRTRIFPVEAGMRRRIIVRYDLVAPREGNVLRVDYFRGTRTASAQTNDRRGGAARPDGRVSLRLTYRDDAELGRPYSPTHELDVRDQGTNNIVEVQEGGRDVTVLFPLRRGTRPAIGVLTHSPSAREDGFALITLSPPAMAPRTTPRDVTIVLDVSGSMAGTKLEQAKQAASRVLGTLDTEDRFRIIDFSSDVRVFRESFVTATRANLASAREYIDGLRAEGGTNIDGALEEALSMRTLPERVPFVLFVTDGAPSVGERNPSVIADHAAKSRGNNRIVTFGVGADLNVSLIEQLALSGRGTAHFVRPEEDLEETLGLVASRIRQPVVTDLRIRAEGVRLVKTMPAMPVDLFAGQDLVVLTRVEGTGNATLRFEGRSGGAPVSWTQTVSFGERERDNNFIPRLWATQRIGWLSAERRRSGGNPELDAEMRELGERYGIPTELTSYFVKEPGMQMPRPGLVGDVSGVMSGVPTGSGRAGNAAPPKATPTSPEMRRARAEEASGFAQARDAQMQRAATSLAAADMAITADTLALDTGKGAARRAGNHVFRLADGVWTDAALRDSHRRVKVEPYSAAYFALAEAIPELREMFALGQRVIAAGRTVAIEVGAGGAKTMTPAEIARIRAAW